MNYYSTRNRRSVSGLKEAAFRGLAPDGGLYMPERIPTADLAEVERLAAVSYADMAAYLAGLFFSDDVPQERLDAMVRKAYDFSCRLRPMPCGTCSLELFHGPTFAFKDFGARFMGGMLGILGEGSSESLTVLTATSGDTGSAVAAGFHNVPGVNVVVLYPEGKVSPLQEAQMSTLGGNITAVRVRGSFDDCQALVKAVFNDTAFRSAHNVTSANSINILRWIPQSFYYFYGWALWKRMTGKDMPDIVVPSGNYGNITAGMLARAMGLPVRSFIAGANANSVVPEFLSSGVYSPRPSVRTVANAMDVGAPSNFERMMNLYGDDARALCSDLRGASYSDAQIKAAIREIHDLGGGFSDPHSAVGYLASKQFGADGFYLSTAHSAKFREVISDATGLVCPLPDALADIMDKPRSFVRMDNDLASLERLIQRLLLVSYGKL